MKKQVTVCDGCGHERMESGVVPLFRRDVCSLACAHTVLDKVWEDVFQEASSVHVPEIEVVEDLPDSNGIVNKISDRITVATCGKCGRTGEIGPGWSFAIDGSGGYICPDCREVRTL